MFWNKEIECASSDKIKMLQTERLAETVRRVYDNVELYRKRMDDLGISPDDIKNVEDLYKLPFTYKSDLNDTYPYGMFAVPMKDIVRIHASSGTTGKQIVAGYTKNDLEVWSELCARSLAAAGCTSESIVQNSYGYGLFTGGMGMNYGVEKIGAAVIPVSTGNTLRQIKIIRDFKPTILLGTPSYALYLAETMEKNGIDPKDTVLKSGIFGAEPWTEEMRGKIEQKLGLKAFDIYGLTEIIGPGVGYECEEQTGMHINEDCFIAETVDPKTGDPLPDGSVGELVFSCINKEGFPLLRYRTHDIGQLTREKCSCGRTFIKMKKPMGRSDDMLIIRGVNVFPSQVESVLLKFEKLAPYYQIIVDRVNNSDTFEILAEALENIGEHELNTITRTMESMLGVSAKIIIAENGTIPRVESKAVHVIDKRKLI